MMASTSNALTFTPRSLQNQKNVYVRALTIADIDRCIELENACFEEHERCSRGKFMYRLTVCPELCLGLFTLTKPHPDTPKGASAFQPQEILVAMIAATKTTAKTVTDTSMKIPESLLPRFDPSSVTATTEATESKPPAVEIHNKQFSETPKKENEPDGHTELGETVCIHSLCVSPNHQKNGYGTTLMKDYMARMRDAGCSTRISLIAHDHLVPMYTKLGYKSLGKSGVAFAGGNWVDCVYDYAENSLKGGR